jgi:hypothetical protein
MRRRLSFVWSLLAALAAGPAAHAADGCAAMPTDPNAMKTPFSVIMTMRGPPAGALAARQGVAGKPVAPSPLAGKTVVSHIRFVGSAMYMHIDGMTGWIGFDIAKLKARGALPDMAKMPKMPPGVTCTRLGEETAGGEPAVIYAFQGNPRNMPVDGKIWLAKASKHPLKMIMNLGGTLHYDAVFDYKTPVAVPPDVKMMSLPPAAAAPAH